MCLCLCCVVLYSACAVVMLELRDFWCGDLLVLVGTFYSLVIPAGISPVDDQKRSPSARQRSSADIGC